MPVNLTITGKIGIAQQLTAAVFNNLPSLTLFPDKKVISFVGSDGIQRDIDVSGNTGMTVTCSSTSTTYTVTVVGT